MEQAFYIIDKLVSPFDYLMMFGVGLMVFCIVFCQSRRHGKCDQQRAGIKRAFFCALLASYLLFTFLITLINRIPASTVKAEWMPFWAWYEVIVHHSWKLLIDNILNVILFIPIGGLIYLVKGIRLKHAVIVGFVLSAMIETLQLLTWRGLFQWDDMLHNTLGCVIGAGVVRWVWKKIVKRHVVCEKQSKDL